MDCKLQKVVKCWAEFGKCDKDISACATCPKKMIICERNHLPCDQNCKMLKEEIK